VCLEKLKKKTPSETAITLRKNVLQKPLGFFYTSRQGIITTGEIETNL